MLDKLIDNTSPKSESLFYEMARNELFHKNKTRNDVVDMLVAQKKSRHEATKIVDDVIFDYASEQVLQKNTPAGQVKYILEQKLLDQHVIIAIIKTIYTNIASDLMKKQKISVPKLKAFLIDKGLNQSEASEIASDFIVKKKKRDNRALINSVLGSIWLIGGLAVTTISYYSDGESYMLAYGAITAGVVQLMIGIGQRNEKLIKR